MRQKDKQDRSRETLKAHEGAEHTPRDLDTIEREILKPHEETQPAAPVVTDSQTEEKSNAADNA